MLELYNVFIMCNRGYSHSDTAAARVRCFGGRRSSCGPQPAAYTSPPIRLAGAPGKALLSIKNNPKRHTTQAPPSGGPKPVLTPSATLSSRFNPVGRSNARRAVSDGILPSEKGIRVTCHRWLSTVNVRLHSKPSPFVVHVSGSEIYHMVLTCVRIVYAKSLQVKR